MFFFMCDMKEHKKWEAIQQWERTMILFPGLVFHHEWNCIVEYTLPRFKFFTFYFITRCIIYSYIFFDLFFCLFHARRHFFVATQNRKTMTVFFWSQRALAFKLGIYTDQSQPVIIKSNCTFILFLFLLFLCCCRCFEKRWRYYRQKIGETDEHLNNKIGHIFGLIPLL